MKFKILVALAAMTLAVPVFADTADVGNFDAVTIDVEGTGSVLNVPSTMLSRAQADLAFKYLVLSPPTFRNPGTTVERAEELRTETNRKFELSAGTLQRDGEIVRQLLREGWRAYFGESDVGKSKIYALLDPTRGIPAGFYFQREVDIVNGVPKWRSGHMLAWLPPQLASFAANHMVNGVPVMVVVYEVDGDEREQLYNSWQSASQFAQLCRDNPFARCNTYQ